MTARGVPYGYNTCEKLLVLVEIRLQVKVCFVVDVNSNVIKFVQYRSYTWLS